MMMVPIVYMDYLLVSCYVRYSMRFILYKLNFLFVRYLSSEANSADINEAVVQEVSTEKENLDSHIAHDAVQIKR